MSENDVFVQCGIRAVKLQQISVSGFLCINTDDVLIGKSVSGSSRSEG